MVDGGCVRRCVCVSLCVCVVCVYYSCVYIFYSSFQSNDPTRSFVTQRALCRVDMLGPLDIILLQYPPKNGFAWYELI